MAGSRVDFFILKSVLSKNLSMVTIFFGFTLALALALPLLARDLSLSFHRASFSLGPRIFSPRKSLVIFLPIRLEITLSSGSISLSS